MLRDKNLHPLSHQHQHGLALCVRIDRDIQKGGAEAARWQREIARAFANEIRYHFEAEEKVLFPVAREFPEMAPLVEELLGEHALLRSLFQRAEAGELELEAVREFALKLAAHIRKEERQLFEECQRLLSREQMDDAGRKMREYFETSGMPGESCGLPGA